MNARDSGKHYRVIKEGGRLSWWEPNGPSSWVGRRQKLSVGDVIRLVRYQRGWGSDPGPDEGWFALVGSDCQGTFHPQTGMWNTSPADGFLEEIVMEAVCPGPSELPVS